MLSDVDAEALFVWMVLMLLMLNNSEQLVKGRGLNIQHLGRGTGQVRQVELQVLRQNSLILEEMPIFLQQLII